MPQTNTSACYDEASAQKIKSIEDVSPELLRAVALDSVATDASETMVFARQLETVSNKMYAKAYPSLKGRSFVPMSADGGNASEYKVYRIWDGYTMAKIVANYATDFPLVTASATEVLLKYFSVGNAYGYSVQDMRAAAKANVPLEIRLAEEARRGHELALDDAIAVGVPSVKTYGLLNHPSIPLLTAPNGTWATATGEQMLDDMNSMITQMEVTSLEIDSPNTMLFSTAAFRKISTKLLSASNASGMTVLQAFQAQNPGVFVGSWTKLNTANAAGTNGRAVVYKRSDEVMQFEIGQEFEVFPGQQTALMITFPCLSRIGGLALFRPLGASYFDNVTL